MLTCCNLINFSNSAWCSNMSESPLGLHPPRFSSPLTYEDEVSTTFLLLLVAPSNHISFPLHFSYFLPGESDAFPSLRAISYTPGTLFISGLFDIPPIRDRQNREAADIFESRAYTNRQTSFVITCKWLDLRGDNILIICRFLGRMKQ